MLRFPFTSVTFLLALAVYASAQPVSPDKETVITHLEMRTLENWHYDPPPPDNVFSEHVFDLFLKRLDPQKRFLLQSDVDTLSRYRDSLDGQLLDNSYAFCEVADALLAKRIGETRDMTRELLKHPLNLDEKDSIAAEPEKQSFCQSPAELQKRWVQLIKFQVLTRVEDKLQEAEAKDSAKDSLGKDSVNQTAKGAASPSKDSKTSKNAAVVKHSPLLAPDTATVREAVAYVARNLDRTFGRMIKEEKLDRVAEYLNTVANVFDPHTEYFKPQAREEFDLAMTGKLEGIGAVLKEDDGYIKVVSIVPGSAAWREKELKAEDKILKVAQGNEEPVDIVDASVEDAVKLIRGKKGTEVRLTVQEAAGQVKTISITRDVVVVEESYAKSAVLESPDSKLKIGYITLPSFYRDFENPNGPNASGDVKRELEKLKAKGVDGVILDLRNNGGGALEDAVAMGGLFITTGPIVQVKNHNGSMEVKTDDDPSVTYAGPLVILVNTFSASASEILAAAMQDYGRAVIVGTDTTWGKGTVQTLVDLDNLGGSVDDNLKPLGTVKVTVQKFYRINGKSTQLRGVAPDILLPDGYTDLDVGERSMDYPMPWDTVQMLDYERWQGMPLADIEAKSHGRVVASPYFQEMNDFLKKEEVLRKHKFVPLSLTDFVAERARNRAESDTLEALEKKATDLAVNPLPTGTDTAASADSVEKAKVKGWKEQLSRDFYLREAVNIADDWANKKK